MAVAPRREELLLRPEQRLDGRLFAAREQIVGKLYGFRSGRLGLEAGDHGFERLDGCALDLERGVRLNLIELDDLLPFGDEVAFLDEDHAHHAAVEMLHGLAAALGADHAVGDGGAVERAERRPPAEKAEEADDDPDPARTSLAASTVDAPRRRSGHRLSAASMPASSFSIGSARSIGPGSASFMRAPPCASARPGSRARCAA